MRPIPRIATVMMIAMTALTTMTASAGAAPTATTAASADYQQVVTITFPFTQDTTVRYRDDYDACRRSGSSGCIRHHQSTDLMVALDTPVHAAASGVVSWRSGSAAGPPSYGWMLNIAGDDGRDYSYVHLGTQNGPMSKAYAPGTGRGDRVEAGQLIGWAGCSGSASCSGGEHLHFEIHDDDVVDPYDYHDHERINPYPSLVAAERRGAYPDAPDRSHWVFSDVAPDSTHGADVEALASSGITRGCGGDRFCPNAAVTREQMASFLTRALDLPAGSRGRFSDVDSSNIHRDDIAALAAAGITLGCGDGRFCPAEPVTREQMASFLTRALDLSAASGGGFSDVGADNPHRDDIGALAAAGITRGCGGDRFCPSAAVTRQQMASFLVRALDL